MHNKTTEQLKRIAVDHAFYSEEKRYAALLELEERGCLTEELKKKKDSFDSEIELDIAEMEFSQSMLNPLLTDDPNAPRLFTKRAIVLFSVLFSILPGSFMLSMNLFRLGKRNAGLLVAGLGLAFTYILGWFSASDMEDSGRLVIGLNAGLALAFIEIFWRTNLNNLEPYKKRPIIVPLIACIVAAGILLYIEFYL